MVLLSGQYYHGKWERKSLIGVWLCDVMDYTAHGIPQARILEWVSCSFLLSIFPIQGSNPSLLHCRRFFTNWVTREPHTTMEDYSSMWRRGNLRVILEKTKQLRKQGNDQQELDICCHFPQWQIIHAKIEVDLFMLCAPVSFMEYFPQLLPWNVIFHTMNNLFLRKIFIIIMVR